MIVDIDTIGYGLEDTGSGEIRIKLNDSRLTSDYRGLAVADSLLGRNVLINGDFAVRQRSSSTITDISSGTFIHDRWRFFKSGSATLDVGDGTAANLKGHVSLSASLSSAASVNAGDFYAVEQRIEGFQCRQLQLGDSVAHAMTLGFWVKTHAGAGTYCVAFQNASADRSYVAEYTVHQDDTWEFKAITVPSDMTGTWGTGTQEGLRLIFTLSAGTTSQTTANTWQSGDYLATADQIDWANSSGAEWLLSQVQLEAGSAATPFEARSFGHELALCQRYYCKTFAQTTAPAQSAGVAGALAAVGAGTGNAVFDWQFPVTMRATPTITTFNPSAANSSARNTTDGTDAAVTSSGTVCDRAVVLKPSSVNASDAGDDLAVHVVAEAEL